jgi:hypothetical protein
MKQAANTLGLVNLEMEIEIRRRAGEAFDQIIELLSRDLKPEARGDIDSLAILLQDTRDQIKLLQKQEEQIKFELKKCFPVGARTLDLPTSLVLLESCMRSGLDKDKLLDEMGVPFVLKYTKTTEYEKLSVKRK